MAAAPTSGGKLVAFLLGVGVLGAFSATAIYPLYIADRRPAPFTQQVPFSNEIMNVLYNK